jgi:hypothetical protein
MERLWKGRSMYGVEPNGLADPDIIPLHSGVEAKGESPTDGPSHGSSHTSFMVQTPFQVPPSSSISNSMPSGPPPIVYAASPLPQSLYPSVVQVYTDNHRSFPASISFPSQDPLSGKSSSPLANPLPEPPRESPYTPSTTSDSRGGHATDYWTKYAGATKAH